MRQQRPLLLALALALSLHGLFLAQRPSLAPEPPSILRWMEVSTQVELVSWSTPALPEDPPATPPEAEAPTEPAISEQPLPEEVEVPEPAAAEPMPAPPPEVSAPTSSAEPISPPVSEPPIDPSAAATPALPSPAPPMPETSSRRLAERSLAMAQLEAQWQVQQQQWVERPRIRRVTSATQLDPELAFYLQQWEARVERIGNQNYPEEARRQNLGGQLRLLVSIYADGRIREAQLLSSSGHPELDEAAIRILNLAAPFAPLPEGVRAETEVLEIIRTWQFGDGWRAR
ncbi:TonB family protein [Marinospirillum sp.]|uniref:TonB family protein n=1 Tax=Marinospirillum sp. TaxID=2183934 RepID=UPI003A8AF70C